MPQLSAAALGDDTNDSGPAIVAARAVVVAPANGVILFAREPHLRGAVASTQKLLTALVTVREGALQKVVTIREEDLDCMPYHLGLQPGEEATRLDLLHALLLGSSNDAAMALARDNAGSIEAFAERMNQTAADCGMLESHFVNPHGLPDDRQYSTAGDVARLACEIDRIPQLRSIMRSKEHRMPRADGTCILLSNRNRLLHDMPECDGMKTGFTSAAGYCLVASSGTGLARRIAVVLNSSEMAVWSDAMTLLARNIEG